MNASANHEPAWLAQYHALIERAGLVDLGHRTQIEVTGADRAKWLHNLTTNEIRKLAPGAGCETFFTSVQGKTLGHGFVFATADALWIDTVPDQAQTLLGHLDHYLITEQVTLADRSSPWRELLLAGPDAERLLRELTAAPPAERQASATLAIGGQEASVRRVDITGPVGFLISAPADEVPAVSEALVAAGATASSPAAFEAARIEWGFPLFGRDITAANLPQEVARDDRCISFVKGCYLGQETVARIDALGHVNKLLAGVRFQGTTVPQPGLELTADGHALGAVTSATYSPKLGAPLAMAYVRREAAAPGTRLQSAIGDGEVVTLPVR